MTAFLTVALTVGPVLSWVRKHADSSRSPRKCRTIQKYVT